MKHKWWTQWDNKKVRKPKQEVKYIKRKGRQDYQNKDLWFLSAYLLHILHILHGRDHQVQHRLVPNLRVPRHGLLHRTLLLAGSNSHQCHISLEDINQQHQEIVTWLQSLSWGRYYRACVREMCNRLQFHEPHNDFQVI